MNELDPGMMRGMLDRMVAAESNKEQVGYVQKNIRLAVDVARRLDDIARQQKATVGAVIAELLGYWQGGKEAEKTRMDALEERVAALEAAH